MPGDAHQLGSQDCVFLASDGFVEDLKRELGTVTEIRERLIFAPMPEEREVPFIYLLARPLIIAATLAVAFEVGKMTLLFRTNAPFW